MRHYAKLLRATLTASLILVAMAGTAVAGAFGDGNAAYKRGDYATAYRLWRPLAERGDAPAQNNVGVAFRYGQGVPQNPAEAEKWFRKAAGQGNADAQYNLGEMQGSQEVQRQRTADILLSLPPWTRQKLGSCKTFARPGEIAIPGVNCTSETPTQRALTPEQNPSSGQNPSSRIEVALKKQGGIFVVPVQINGAITLDFTVDSGAADVSVPADVFSTLTRTDSIRDTDIIGRQTYVLADGSKSQSFTFTIRSLKVGDTVVENVRGSVATSRGSLLLGQSFLERFKSRSIDNTKHELLLEPQ